MKRCLIIFAKEPQKGRVKTRLEGRLSQTDCVRLYKAFLRDSIDVVNRLQCEEKIIAYDSQNKSPRFLKRIAPRFLFYKQKGKDLGQRMYNAFQFVKAKRFERTIIIGSDSPTLPVRSLEKAFRLLREADIVLGPSSDGGFYLIGMKSPSAALFKDIQWSSRTVFRDTVDNARGLKKRVALLTQLYDVDDADALIKLQRDLGKPQNRHIATWTKKILNFVL